MGALSVSTTSESFPMMWVLLGVLPEARESWRRRKHEAGANRLL